MNSNTSSNQYGLNNTHNRYENNIERYISQFCEYRVELSNHLDEITHVQSLLVGTEIWPDQCEYAIQTLNTVRKPVRNLFKLLSSLRPLPSEIKFNRYPVIVESQRVDKQVSDLISLLAIYRDLADSSKKYTIKEQSDLNYKIGQIGDRCENLVQTLDSIINQAVSFNPQVF